MKNKIEIYQNQTVVKIATVQTEGTKRVQRDIEYFNLDMIISIGYRVDSKEESNIYFLNRNKIYGIQT